MAKKQNKKIAGLIVALVVVLGGGVLFVGAVSGWFSDTRVKIDAEFYCEEGCEEFTDLSVGDYEELIAKKKSFIVFVDQGGCTAADRLRGYVVDWARENGVKVMRIMFEGMRETSLHDYVKYYPSVALVSKGKVMRWLKADSDEDAEEYNDYTVFREWLESGIFLVENTKKQ